jgi:tRNA pseudouridine38-40 synthase
MEGHPHARFDALERTYEYFVHTEKDPFLQNHSYFFANKNLNIEKIIAAVSLLTRYEDFQSFCKTPEHNQTTICKLTKAQCYYSQEGSHLKFEFTANRFLRGMIRIIVQKLLEVGANQISMQEFEDLLNQAKTPDIKAIAAPYGLYLTKVNYSFLNVQPKTFPPPFQIN